MSVLTLIFKPKFIILFNQINFISRSCYEKNKQYFIINIINCKLIINIINSKSSEVNNENHNDL